MSRRRRKRSASEPDVLRRGDHQLVRSFSKARLVDRFAAGRPLRWACGALPDGYAFTVSFRVVVRVSAPDLPADIETDLRQQMKEIAESLGDIPAEHPLWESLEIGGLLLDIRSWRFSYRVDRKRKMVVVDQAVLKEE